MRLQTPMTKLLTRFRRFYLPRCCPARSRCHAGPGARVRLLGAHAAAHPGLATYYNPGVMDYVQDYRLTRRTSTRALNASGRSRCCGRATSAARSGCSRRAAIPSARFSWSTAPGARTSSRCWSATGWSTFATRWAVLGDEPPAGRGDRLRGPGRRRPGRGHQPNPDPLCGRAGRRRHQPADRNAGGRRARRPPDGLADADARSACAGAGPLPAAPAEPTATPVPPTPTAIWPPPLTPSSRRPPPSPPRDPPCRSA